jgi:nitrogen regulatory protein P-II 1
MKLITAVIKAHKLDDVRAALTWFGIRGMTITTVLGCGTEFWHTETYRGTRYISDLTSKIRIDIVTAETDVGDLVEVIAKAATTGGSGDGKIWVTPVDQVIRIRTGQYGPDAL